MKTVAEFDARYRNYRPSNAYSAMGHYLRRRRIELRERWTNRFSWLPEKIREKVVEFVVRRLQ